MTFWSIGQCPSNGATLARTWYLFFLRLHFFMFRERGKGRREGEKDQCVVASHMPPTWDLVRNPGLCPDWESNQRLWFAGWLSVHWATPARASCFYLLFFMLLFILFFIFFFMLLFFSFSFSTPKQVFYFSIFHASASSWKVLLSGHPPSFPADTSSPC